MSTGSDWTDDVGTGWVKRNGSYFWIFQEQKWISQRKEYSILKDDINSFVRNSSFFFSPSMSYNISSDTVTLSSCPRITNCVCGVEYMTIWKCMQHIIIVNFLSMFSVYWVCYFSWKCIFYWKITEYKSVKKTQEVTKKMGIKV